MKIFRKRENQYEIGRWYIGWKSWKFDLTYRSHGYDSPNAELHISMLGWHSIIILPWICEDKDAGWREEKKYGVSIHGNTVFWHWGYDLKGWDIPFVSYGTAVRWDRYVGPKEFDDRRSNWETHPHKTRYTGGCEAPTIWACNYTDPYDGMIVPCKFWVEEMEWRPKWLKWTKLFAKKRRFIEVEFSAEMGPRKGSWKGGTIGCGFKMLPGECPTETMARMQREYTFS